MDDRAWLSAIGTDWSQRPRWRDGSFSGGASELARVLREETKSEPERFLALLWRLPPDGSQVFARAILEGLAETNLDTEALDALLTDLEDRLPPKADEHTLLSLISQRKSKALGRKGLVVLAQIAETGDTGKDHEPMHKDQGKPEALFRVAMNRGHELAWRGRETARGKALDLLGRLAWHDKSIFERCRHLVDRALDREEPERLLAATGVFVQAAIKHDLLHAGRWLSELIEQAPLSLASESGRSALLHLDQLDHDAARPLLLALLNGSDAAMSALAAAVIFVGSFDDARWAQERELILGGCDEWRAAAAHVVAGQVEPDRRDPELNARVVEFFDDDSELVRTAVADVFRTLGTSAMGLHADLYRGYLNSSSFEGERTYFLHRLEDAPAELDELVLELIEAAADRISSATAAQGSVGYRLWEPLMRIYTSNEGDGGVRRRCLDVIDLLVSRDIGGSDKLQEATR